MGVMRKASNSWKSNIGREDQHSKNDLQGAMSHFRFTTTANEEFPRITEGSLFRILTRQACGRAILTPSDHSRLR
eukprot:3717131-Rhodomonas_salina.4